MTDRPANTSSFVRVIRDPDLTARVISRVPLIYTSQPANSAAAPPHVRAASGIARLHRFIAIIQDDANWLALTEIQSQDVYALPLPAGPGGHRLFDDRTGRKQDKLDLEACICAPVSDKDMLIAFGSGSLPQREQVVIVPVDHEKPTAGKVRVCPVPELYRNLRQALCPDTGELNIEGSALLPSGILRLFHRGNTTPGSGGAPPSASCDIHFNKLWDHLQDSTIALQFPFNLVRYDLPTLEGIRLAFTDATAAPTGVMFLAAAEDSPDAIIDGPVTGSAIGIITPDGARWAPIIDEEGQPLPIKAEGILLNGNLAQVVVDPDNPDQPAELLNVALGGGW